ncbi:MAG: glucuronate isomerase [Oscillospiraceae bacterium]|nr:glucuronate isomerase [Oscillospiraceae bacterium]
MKTVGIMCADSSDPYLAQAVYYVEENLRRHNYDVILSCTGYDHAVKERQMKMLMSKRVDAVILAGSNYAEASDELNSYITTAAKSVPIMLINGIISAPNVYCTVCDDYFAVYEVTDKILSSGKKAPIYIYNSNSYSAKQKLNGFMAAIKNHGISLEKERLLYIDTRGKKNVHFSVGDVKKAVAKLADKGFPIDCAIAADDILAVGALKYTKEAGLAIPQDFAAAGYNNFDISECCDPDMSVRNIIRRSGVEVICTTDDPVDSLEWHKIIAEDKSFEVGIVMMVSNISVGICSSAAAFFVIRQIRKRTGKEAG